MPTIQSGQMLTPQIVANFAEYDVSNVIFDLDTNIARFTKILSKLPSYPADNILFYHWSTPEDPKYIKATIDYPNGNETSLIFDNPNYAKVGDVLINQSTREQLYVSVAPITGATTVVRGTPSYAIAEGDVFSLLGSGFPEASSVGTGKHLEEEEKWNYLQIFKEDIDISRTAANVKLRTGANMRDRLDREAGRRILRRMELSFLFGKRGTITDANSKSVRLMGGVEEFITSNAHDVNGVLTEDYFDKMLLQDFQWGSSEKYLFASALAINKITSWGKGRMETDVGRTETYGFAINKYLTSQGNILYVVEHPLLKGANAQDWTGFGGYMFVIDFDSFKKRYLVNSDLKFKENLPTSDDKHIDQYLGEIGMDRVNEEKNAVYRGITG